MRNAHGCVGIVALVPAGCLTYLLSREVNRKRFTMLKQFKNIARALRVPSAEERESAYLNGAIDRIDLEYRQRQIDRGLFRKSY